MENNDCLIEIGCEELPPTALKPLSLALQTGIAKGLTAHALHYNELQYFASPRRLAVLINGLDAQAVAKENVLLGPRLAQAKDSAGQWTRAASGFASKHGVTPDNLSVIDTPKGATLCLKQQLPGAQVQDVLPTIVSQALETLPIPKRMRWGSHRETFVRPVHWLVMLYGNDVVDATILGQTAGRHTQGHRFHCSQALVINHPGDYETLLASDGYVVADFDARQTLIRQQVTAEASKLGGAAVIDDALLEEVTALVEWPIILSGHFDEDFLALPPEALVLSMQTHQRYFHIIDDSGQLLPYFITVANVDSQQPEQVVRGNERVIRPRLSDALFFFRNDQKTALAERVDALKTVVFQEQLGSLFDKTQRLKVLAAALAPMIGADAALASRAAELSKADLLAQMVQEFDKMQGIAGGYYALQDGEAQEVAEALKEHYLPRFAGDQLPVSPTGIALALADRLDTLVGIFGIGEQPTGSKDPFALRRAAVAVLRIIIERKLTIDLHDAFSLARQQYSQPLASIEPALHYCLERLRSYYHEQAIPTEVILAVMAKNLSQPLDIHQRILATHRFNQTATAAMLAEANKRVANMLAEQTVTTHVDQALLTEPAEQVLANQIHAKQTQLGPLLIQRHYDDALDALAELHPVVDRFFTEVMVMVDDIALRHNRLALLQQLRELFLEIADIALLVPVKR